MDTIRVSPSSISISACPSCGQPTPRHLCTACCEAIARTNRLNDWDAIPASARGDTSQQLTEAVIETMRAMQGESE
jgi:hypothetical protein